MESSFQGDLLDMLRSTGVAGGGRSAAGLPLPPPVDHQLISGGGFGDPFLTMRDPLMAELPAPTTVAEEKDGARSGFQITTSSSGGGGGGVVAKNPSSARSSSSSSCLVESSRVQISAPRNPIIKRRKSQAKKVVCIPAPTTANSRQGGGEVVPSDLWAWRKYGQKPIKGSPFPRGYYRCSSSKGCSARKQVERSRTDPNMLVITYTSEHNHPWPTQRNALAGSTRVTSTAPTSPSNPSPPPPTQMTTTVGETHDHQQTLISATSNGIGPEPEDQTNQDHSSMNQIVFDYDDKSYRPVVQDECGEDFFADLRELEMDPLNMMFTGFTSEGEEKGESKPVLDPFSGLFDWTSNNTTSTTSDGGHKSS